MEQISKNCYKYKLITNASDINKLALDKKSIYTPFWGVKPAAILLEMQFKIIMDLIDRKLLFAVIKN